MDRKIILRILIVTLVFTFISFANNMNNWGSLDSLRGIQVFRLITLGIGIGASMVTVIMLIISKRLNG